MQNPSDPLDFDPCQEVRHLVSGLREAVLRMLRKRGAVVGVSGGVDSAVALALCVEAFGPRRVIALLLPEKESSPESQSLARELAAKLGVEPIIEEITPALEGFGCYRRRDDAIRRLFPQYDPHSGFKVKIVLPSNLLTEGSLNVYTITLLDPEGKEQSRLLPPQEFLEIVAASNFKQRTRMAFLYHYAELHNYAVIGTANKNEHEQGFFVKFGDSGVDVRLLRHLYKTQIYRLAGYLGIPEAIQSRAPTTDTYSAPCTQQEFFFRLPFPVHDRLLHLAEYGGSREQLACELHFSTAEVERALADIGSKRRATEYLRMPPIDLAPEDRANPARSIWPSGGPLQADPKPPVLPHSTRCPAP